MTDKFVNTKKYSTQQYKHNEITMWKYNNIMTYHIHKTISNVMINHTIGNAHH